MKIAALAALEITPALVFILAEAVAAPPPVSAGETWGLTNSQDAAVAPYAAWTSVHVSTNSGVLSVSDITGHGFDMTNHLGQSRWPLLNGSSFQCNGTNTLGFFGTATSLNGVAINNAAVNISPPFYWFTVMAITNQGGVTGSDPIASQYGFTESAFPVIQSGNHINIQTWERDALTTFHNIVTNQFMLFELDFLGNASSTAYTNGVQGAIGNAGPNVCSNLTIGSFWDMSHFSAQFSFVGLAVFTNMTPNARSNITYFTINQFNFVHPVLTVASDNPDSGVAVTVSPNDNNGAGNGTTSFTRAYKDGTVVTLTAPAAVNGNNFQKWQKDGADYSSSASTNVTMDADHNMTAIYVSPGGTASYVTGKTLGTPRNSYNGFAGMKITVGANPVTVTALGRLEVSGNTGTHTVKLVNAVGGTDVTGGSVSVTMSGETAGDFTYATLSSPVVLAAGSSYYLVSQETFGGDQYYGAEDTTVTTTAVATEVSGVYGAGGGAWSFNGDAGQTYGPVDFQYSVTQASLLRAARRSTTAPSSVGANVIIPLTGNAEPLAFQLLGDPGKAYKVECSPDLINWSPLSGIIKNEIINIRDTNASRSQFYRFEPISGR
jgi:hypothetical protein